MINDDDVCRSGTIGKSISEYKDRAQMIIYCSCSLTSFFYHTKLRKINREPSKLDMLNPLDMTPKVNWNPCVANKTAKVIHFRKT